MSGHGAHTSHAMGLAHAPGDTLVPAIPLPWMERLDEGMFCLSAEGLVLCANAAGRKLLNPQGSAEPGVKPVLALLRPQSPDALQALLAGSSQPLTTTLLTARGPVRTILSIHPSQPPLPGDLLLMAKSGSGEAQAGSAAGIIAFYSLLMHEIKNPLAAVKMLVQGMQLELASQDGQPGLAASPVGNPAGARSVLDTYLMRATREIDRVTRRMDSVKFLSKLSLELSEPYDLTSVARGVAGHLSQIFDKNHVRCQLVLDEQGAFLSGDPDEMRQVLLNLFDFALESLGERGGLLRLVVRGEGDWILLQLTDTGAGYTAEEISALYARTDPFRSGSLGLSVARWIIERYQGQLQFVSQKGRGTTVEVRLPRARSESGERGRQRP